MTRLKTLWCLLNMPCEGMSRLTSESHDRELGRLERIALWSHLLYCAACRRYSRHLELIHRAMRRLADHVEKGESSLDPGLPDDVREQIKQVLKQERTS